MIGVSKTRRIRPDIAAHRRGRDRRWSQPPPVNGRGVRPGSAARASQAGNGLRVPAVGVRDPERGGVPVQPRSRFIHSGHGRDAVFRSRLLGLLPHVLRPPRVLPATSPSPQLQGRRGASASEQCFAASLLRGSRGQRSYPRKRSGQRLASLCGGCAAPKLVVVEATQEIREPGCVRGLVIASAMSAARALSASSWGSVGASPSSLMKSSSTSGP